MPHHGSFEITTQTSSSSSATISPRLAPMEDGEEKVDILGMLESAVQRSSVPY